MNGYWSTYKRLDNNVYQLHTNIADICDFVINCKGKITFARPLLLVKLCGRAFFCLNEGMKIE